MHGQFECMRENLLGLQVHVGDIERFICTIKERMRCTFTTVMQRQQQFRCSAQANSAWDTSALAYQVLLSLTVVCCCLCIKVVETIGRNSEHVRFSIILSHHKPIALLTVELYRYLRKKI